MARCTRAAATAESTPAGQPAQHPLVADRGADRGDLLVDDVGVVHVGSAPAMS